MFGISWSRSTQWIARVTILAILVTGITGYVSLNKTIYIDIDGRVAQFQGLSRNVKDVLRTASVTLNTDDTVNPSLATAVADGDYITVRTAKYIDVEIDGKTHTIKTNAATVGDMLDELGSRAINAQISASRNTPVGRELVKIATMKTVSVTVDGGVIERTTNLPTVRDLLLDLEVVVEEGDTISLPLDEQLTDNSEIVVSRAGSTGDTVTETLAFETVEKEDPTLLKGEKVVLQKGRVGKSVTTYDVATLNGTESERKVIAQSIIAQPQDEIIGIGTLDPVDPSAKILSPSEARALGKSMVLNRGWEETEFQCLDKLWTKESNWRVQATNSSSGAYGIPQSYPGNKMASIGADWRTNAKTQITWGLNYISGRYGTPCNAWAHSQRKNWY